MCEKRLSKREHSVLSVAVKFGWAIEYDSRGRATWDGDYLMPFRAHETAKQLVRRGLMERISSGIYGSHVRATSAARDYRCAAEGCDRGVIYEDDDDGCYSREVGKCPTCNGSGLAFIPAALLAAANGEGSN